MSATDLYVLHSAGEAFPNVLIQAMACEKVCITTDVGDAKIILGDENFVIAPKNSCELEHKIKYAMSLSNAEKEQIGKKNRQRVLDNYTIQAIVKEYEKIYTED
jgi:glycosyltransferase involved in cell wall biosynthesis